MLLALRKDPKKIVATARKLLTVVYAVLRDKKPYIIHTPTNYYGEEFTPGNQLGLKAQQLDWGELLTEQLLKWALKPGWECVEPIQNLGGSPHRS